MDKDRYFKVTETRLVNAYGAIDDELEQLDEDYFTVELTMKVEHP